MYYRGGTAAATAGDTFYRRFPRGMPRSRTRPDVTELLETHAVLSADLLSNFLVDFNGVRFDPLGSRSPPYERIKFGYPVEDVRFLLLSTNL